MKAAADPQTTLCEELERAIDKYGLSFVLESLSLVCHVKSEHILTAWQDRGLARLWSRLGTMIATMAGRPSVRHMTVRT